VLAGFRVVRFGWQQVLDEPDAVQAALRALAARAA
jgi:hypothetical protein